MNLVLLTAACAFVSLTLSNAPPLRAQAVMSAPKTGVADPFTAPQQAQMAEITVPRMTPIFITIDAAVSSNENSAGETFAITLAEPIVIDGVEVVSAGVSGEGEIIHAKKSGGGGTPGELILTARFLTIGDVSMPLRSMTFDAEAQSRMNTVNAISVAAAAAAPPLALIGFFIKGGAMAVEPGTWASAKVAQDTVILVPQPAETQADLGADVGAQAPIDVSVADEDNPVVQQERWAVEPSGTASPEIE